MPEDVIRLSSDGREVTYCLVCGQEMAPEEMTYLSETDRPVHITYCEPYWRKQDLEQAEEPFIPLEYLLGVEHED